VRVTRLTAGHEDRKGHEDHKEILLLFFVVFAALAIFVMRL
jgi:hypothetical protein